MKTTSTLTGAALVAAVMTFGWCGPLRTASAADENPAEERVKDFLFATERQMWGMMARRLTDDYLQTCGGSANAVASVLIRDLGARPIAYETEVRSFGDRSAEVLAELELEDDSAPTLNFHLEKREEGWRISAVRILHREHNWKMCEEVPEFARGQAEQGP